MMTDDSGNKPVLCHEMLNGIISDIHSVSESCVLERTRKLKKKKELMVGYMSG